MTAVKTRKLSDLFRKGKPFTLDDGDGGVDIYLAKLNPVQTEKAIRKANAHRARYLSSMKDKESDIYLAAANDVWDMEFEELVQYAVADELARRSSAIEAEFAEEAGWMKDDYLQGLHDAWNDGLQEVYFETDDEAEKDPEALRVFQEMEKYSNQVSERMLKEQDALTKDYETKDVEKLREQMIERVIKMQADMAWMIEYRKSEVFFGTYTATTPRKPYFANRQEVDELEETTLTTLIAEIGTLSVEVEEGKDSPLTEDSSAPSELPETPEVEDSSSLESVSQ